MEAIRSVLPVCNDFVVAVGDCEDETRAVIASIDPKIRIIDTVWDKNLNTGGAVLADETNKAYEAIDDDTDWCFYIQGDEVMHEKYLDTVYKGMQQWKDDMRVDGLLFKYLHFYGSYDYVGVSSNWYRNEVRIIRKNSSFYSYKDAQGFRKGKDEKLSVKSADAYIYHYGWVREPEKMKSKVFYTGYYWSGLEIPDADNILYSGKFDYSQINALKKFQGSHPEIMQDRINKKNWKFEYELGYNKLSLKERFKNLIEKLTGKRPFDYSNYKII